MPLGISNFPDLIEKGCYFVDKTHVIRELCQHRNQVTLFTRPRRFGKTLTLSMIASFFDMSKKDQIARWFQGTNIAKDEAIMKMAGTYPVVMISLKDVSGRTPEEILNMMRLLLSSLYQPYQFLRESDCLTLNEKNFFERISSGKSSLADMRASIHDLTGFLHRYYHKKPLLLIDEYDAPIQCAWDYGCYDEVISFFRPFYSSAFKDNDSLGFAVITGVLRVAKESIFSGLNNLTVSTVLHGGYADAFGFTPQEVDEMAETLGCADKLPELARWYDGYHFQGADIYNPWSVLNYFYEDCKPRPFWVNTSSNSILRTMLRRADTRAWKEMQTLLSGGSIVSAVTESTIYSEKMGAQRNELYSVLLFCGYLQCTDEIIDEDRTEEPLYRLSIPNTEIRFIYRREVLYWMNGTEGTDIALYDMLQAMMTGDTAGFEENLQDLLLRTVSYHDTAKQPEVFYHGLMLGFTLYYEHRYRTQSNRESGCGRFGLAMFPKKAGLPGIIMEFKAAESTDHLAASAKEALTQIDAKDYLAEFRSEHITSVWKYGIAFCGKQVAIQST
ncbi:MAG: ATP-binding protein [Selenomonas sp.]|nr:ATP-binding protein [Selenomonas sp.]